MLGNVITILCPNRLLIVPVEKMIKLVFSKRVGNTEFSVFFCSGEFSCVVFQNSRTIIWTDGPG